MRQEARAEAKSVRVGGAFGSPPTSFCRGETTCQKCARPAARDWRRWSLKTASQGHPATPRPSTTRSKSFTLRYPLLLGVGVYAQTPTRSNATVSMRNEAVLGGTGGPIDFLVGGENRGLRASCGEVEGSGHQRAGVGVLGRGHNPFGRAGLHDLAVLHDQDLVC